MKTFLLLFCVFNNQTQNHINNNYTPDNNYNNNYNYTPTTTTTSTTIIFYNNMNIIIIVIPLISCYLLRFTHAVTSLLPRCDPWPHKQSSLVTLLPPLPCSVPLLPLPLHCRCYLCAFLWLFFALLSLYFHMRFHFRFLFWVLCNLSPRSHPPPFSLPLPALFMLHAFDFVLLFSASSFCFCQFPLELILCLNLPPPTGCPCSCSSPSCCHFPLAVC